MVVKVVGQDESVKKCATCKQCGAILEFHATDVKEAALYLMGEWEGTRRYVVCPVCGNQVTVKEGRS